jgi:hypothetical protein
VSSDYIIANLNIFFKTNKWLKVLFSDFKVGLTDFLFMII